MSNRARTDLFLAFDRWGWDERGWARSTRSRYLARARAADSWLREDGSPPLVWSEDQHLRKYLFQTSPTAGNRNDIRVALIAFFDFTIAQQWRLDNPARPLPRLPVPKPLPKALPVDEARRIVVMAQSLPPMQRAMWTLLLFCGLRREEARMLEWRAVSEGYVTVMGKGSKERAVPLHPFATLALDSHRMHSKAGRYVFASPRREGQPISRSWMQMQMEELRDATGLKMTIHSLRHTCATRLLDTGANLREVQEFLGHASPTTTAIYTRVSSKALQEATLRLDFAGPMGIADSVNDAENA